MGGLLNPNLADLTSVLESLRTCEERLSLATEALQKSEERAIAGRVALELMHEIRNPLEALGHIAHLTAQDAEDPQRVRSYMVLAKEQMGTLSEIAKNTLGFAQTSAKPRNMGLVVVAEAAIRIHQQAIKQKRIRLVAELPESAVAEVYTGEMLQVVSNLIVNALDALPGDGVLRLRLRKRPGKVELVIADNGSGIPPDCEEAIFRPFFTTKVDRGTGLGLALSKRIVERHRGRIRMRSSVRPGRSGTIFKISLPLS
jgi:signal transduction histidine kinase